MATEQFVESASSTAEQKTVLDVTLTKSLSQLKQTSRSLALLVCSSHQEAVPSFCTLCNTVSSIFSTEIEVFPKNFFTILHDAVSLLRLLDPSVKVV